MPTFDRAGGRASILLVAAALLLAAALAPASAGAATARSADAFVDSIGVNVHLGYTGTPYTEKQQLIEQRLEELGVRHVRDGLIASNPGNEFGALGALAAAGIHSTLILGDPTEGNAALETKIGLLKSNPDLRESVEAVEGPNEFSTMHNSEHWEEELRNFQKLLWEKIKGDSDPRVSSLPVLAPALVGGGQKKLGDVSAYLDYGNVHSYPEGGPPEESIGVQLTRAKFNSASKPVEATETGYTNALKWTPAGKGENRPVPESAGGTYTPRLFLEYWNLGLIRTFDYELVDLHSDPGETVRDDHFGLLRNDLTPKPSFESLRNLISILSDPGPAFTPGSLEYTAAGGTAKLKSTLLEKRDGRFYLALWREQSVWNAETKQAIPAPAEPATVTLPTGVGSYAVYEPSVSAAPRASGGPTSSIPVSVGPGVTLIELQPVTPALLIASAPPLVSTLVAGGPGALASAPAPGGCRVPHLEGRVLLAAKAAANRSGCRLTVTARRQSSEAKRHHVLVQSPAAGKEIAAGGTIRITVGR